MSSVVTIPTSFFPGGLLMQKSGQTVGLRFGADSVELRLALGSCWVVVSRGRGAFCHAWGLRAPGTLAFPARPNRCGTLAEGSWAA